MSGPLEGLIVADFSRVLAGPLATMILGDLGADVIKVERPGSGDDSRAWGPPFVDGESAYYLAANRNKRSVALDLATPEGREAARRLAERADVLIENFRAGTMERLGLGYETLARRNPGLVYCSISGFGRGAGADLPGYDFLVQSVGGLMSITGPEDGPPTKAGVALVDVLTGLYAVIGIQAALADRQRTGEGQRVEVNLLSSLLASLANQASTYLTTGTVPRAMGNRHPSVAPYETLRAASGTLVVAVGNDRQFASMCAALGRPGLADDPRFATNAQRVRNRRALVEALEDALADDTVEGAVARLRAAGVPAGAVNDLAQAFRLAEDLGLEPVVTVTDGERVIRQAANAIRLSRSAVSYRLPPPRLGEHTAEILRWLGMEDRASRVAGGCGGGPSGHAHGTDPRGDHRR